MTPPLAPTIVARDAQLRDQLGGVRRARCRSVQLTASGAAGIRPRELSASARRDLAGTLARLELQPAGIDLWIPSEHFAQGAHQDRALDAVNQTCGLAAVLHHCAVTVALPDPLPEAEILEALESIASGHGVLLADAGCPGRTPPAGMLTCVDAAAWLSAGHDPIAAAAQPEVAVRLSDCVHGARAIPGEPGGALDVQAFKVACDVAAPQRPVVADLRFLHDPQQAMQRMMQVWDAGPTRAAATLRP